MKFDANNEEILPFENLLIWKKAIDLANKIYELTRAFPQDERFALKDQINRAAVSVFSNIAESCGRKSLKDRIRFIDIANGSLYEVFGQLLFSQSRQYVPVEAVRELRVDVLNLSRGIAGYRNYLQKQLDQ